MNHSLGMRSGKQLAGAVQVFGRVNTRARCIVSDVYRNAVAVPKGAQLFKLLQLLQGSLGKTGKFP